MERQEQLSQCVRVIDNLGYLLTKRKWKTKEEKTAVAEGLAFLAQIAVNCRAEMETLEASLVMPQIELPVEEVNV